MSIKVDIVGSGPNLVLIHGWGMNSLVWGVLVDQLAERYCLHLVSLPGHGGSEFDVALDNLDAWSDVVLAAVPSGAIWLGWSLGGLVAMNAALRDSAAIDGLILLASTPRFVEDEDWRHAVTGSVFDGFKQMLSEDSHSTLMRFLALQVQNDKRARELLMSLRKQMATLPEPAAAALAVGLAILRRSDLRSKLSSLPCRRVWILGTRDTLVPWKIQDALLKLDPQSTVRLISGAGHAPMLSHTKQCMQYIEEFLCP